MIIQIPGRLIELQGLISHCLPLLLKLLGMIHQYRLSPAVRPGQCQNKLVPDKSPTSTATGCLGIKVNSGWRKSRCVHSAADNIEGLSLYKNGK